MPLPADCPDPAEFESMLLGRATDDRAAFLEAHVEGCLACQQRVDGLAVNPRLTAALRRGPVEPPGEAAGLDDMVARLDDLASQFSSVHWTNGTRIGRKALWC